MGPARSWHRRVQRSCVNSREVSGAGVSDDGASAAPVVRQAPIQAFVIIIQFTDRNDAYLRGQAVPGPAPKAPGVTIIDIARDISHRFGLEYMGQRYDPVTQTYMLRYMRKGEAVDFYVDARTGKVIGREGF